MNLHVFYVHWVFYWQNAKHLLYASTNNYTHSYFGKFDNEIPHELQSALFRQFQMDLLTTYAIFPSHEEWNLEPEADITRK